MELQNTDQMLFRQFVTDPFSGVDRNEIDEIAKRVAIDVAQRYDVNSMFIRLSNLSELQLAQAAVMFDAMLSMADEFAGPYRPLYDTLDQLNQSTQDVMFTVFGEQGNENIAEIVTGNKMDATDQIWWAINDSQHLLAVTKGHAYPHPHGEHKKATGMIEFHVTFGYDHVEYHRTHGNPWVSQDGWLTVIAPNEVMAREFAIAVLGRHWSFIYDTVRDEYHNPEVYRSGELARIEFSIGSGEKSDDNY